MTLAALRILDLPEKLNAVQIFKDTDKGFCEFSFGWAYNLNKYFDAEPASAVNYKACMYDGHTRRNGTLTVKRNGDFTFTPV